MNRRTLLLSAAAAAALPALPAAAAKLSLNEISAYLNSLKTATGEFTQINGDGTISTGTIYIKRPGRVRFEYNPPEASLVMAGGSTVAIFDGKSNTGPEQYPLAKTPLKLILDANVNLGRANMVVGHSVDGNSTKVTAQDPEHPEYGTIELLFTGPPVELRQWIIRSDGSQTTVILGALNKGTSIGDSKFNIQQEIASRRGQNR